MTAFDTIVAALHGHGCQVQQRGDNARAQCPAHDSTGLTLSIRTDGERARVHCFAGCSDVDVLEVLGFGVADLFDHPPAPGYVPPARRVLTPWEEACARIGIHHPPPIEHLLNRMVVEQEKERRAAEWRNRVVVTCQACGTETSPWTCSCGQTRVDPHRGEVA